MTNNKMFKINEPVYMNVGEDALYVETNDGTHKYVPAELAKKTCYPVQRDNKYSFIYDCSECGGFIKESIAFATPYSPSYCKWCGAKIDW